MADPGGGGWVRGKGGASVPPFGLHVTLRSTDDKPPFLGIELTKLLLRLTLEEKSLENKINWTGSLSQKISKLVWFCPKVGVTSKLSRARVYYNPTSRNPPLSIADKIFRTQDIQVTCK